MIREPGLPRPEWAVAAQRGRGVTVVDLDVRSLRWLATCTLGPECFDRHAPARCREPE